MDFATELQDGDPWKIIHSNFINSPSIVSNTPHVGEILNHVKLSSQTIFDCGFSFTFQKQNTESENT